MRKIIVTLFFIGAWLSGWAQFASDEELALQYYQSGEHEKAAAIFQKLFAQNKNRAQNYDTYLSSLLVLKRYDDAEKLVKNMMKTYSDNYNYQVDYGKVLRERGKQDEATRWYNSLIRSLPKTEFLIRELSVSFYRAEAFDFSTKALLNGRNLLGDETAFAFDLIALYRFQKNKVMLVEEYVSLFSNQPEPMLLNQAKSTFATIFDTPQDYDLLKTALLKKLQKDPQNIPLSDLLAWQYIQQKQFDLALKQVISLDKRLKENGERVYDLASIFIDNNAHEAAIEALQYLLKKGPESQYYIPAKMQLVYNQNKLLTTGKFNREQLLQLEKDYLELFAELGKNRNTIFAIRQLAHLQSSYLNKPKEAAELLEQTLKMPGLPPTQIGQIKLELGDVYILTGEVWEASLIYGQAERELANSPVGQEAKFKNARLSYYLGDFTWAKAQLSVLKSSTSQLIANDALNLELLINENTETAADSNALKRYAYADLLILNNQFDEAVKTLDSINVLFPNNSLEDDILISKAKIYQRLNNPGKAIEQLQQVIARFSTGLWADDSVFMLAEIYENTLQDTAQAMTYYQKLITDYPGSLYVIEARKRFRNLRGDNLG